VHACFCIKTDSTYNAIYILHLLLLKGSMLPHSHILSPDFRAQTPAKQSQSHRQTKGRTSTLLIPTVCYINICPCLLSRKVIMKTINILVQRNILI